MRNSIDWPLQQILDGGQSPLLGNFTPENGAPQNGQYLNIQ
jgi:hypothetical protein